MALMDFLFGSPSQTENRLDPNVQAFRDSLLARLQTQYENPINMPMYMAVSPDYQYAGANQLLNSLGLGQVSAPNLPTTEINGMTVYDTAPLAEQIEARFREANPDFMTPAERNAQRAAAAAAAGAVTNTPSNNDNDDDPLALHYSLFPMENPANFQNSLTTGGPSAASQSVFQTADLYGNHGGNHFSKIADDVSTGVSNFVSGGGIIGAIANAFSGNNNDDDPSIGNVP